MGPGSHLHAMIEQWTGQKPRLSCKCAAWIKKMDREGPAWCWKHLDEIVAKLIKEAKQRAVAWRAVPVDENGNLLNTIRNMILERTFIIPGTGTLLEPFVRSMVVEAIQRSES